MHINLICTFFRSTVSAVNFQIGQEAYILNINLSQNIAKSILVLLNLLLLLHLQATVSMLEKGKKCYCMVLAHILYEYVVVMNFSHLIQSRIKKYD